MNALWGNKKYSNITLLNGASDWKASVDLKRSLQFSVHIIHTGKLLDIVAWSDSKKSVPLWRILCCKCYPAQLDWFVWRLWCPHRIDWTLERKPGGGTWAEEEPTRDTVCRLREKELDMPCDSYWRLLLWFSRILNHFVSFQNSNHWSQIEIATYQLQTTGPYASSLI